MLDKDVYYVKKLKQQMLSIFNMVMKTEEMAMKETAESGELSVSEIHTLVAVGRRAPKTMSTIAQDLLQMKRQQLLSTVHLSRRRSTLY